MKKINLRFVLTLVALIASVILFAACGDAEEKTPEPENNIAETTNEFDGEIRDILGVEYVITEKEQSFEMPDGRMITWRIIDLRGNEPALENFAHATVSDLFGTRIGEVLLVGIDGEAALWIDIGDAGENWSHLHRAYSVFQLN